MVVWCGSEWVKLVGYMVVWCVGERVKIEGFCGCIVRVSGCGLRGCGEMLKKYKMLHMGVGVSSNG